MAPQQNGMKEQHTGKASAEFGTDWNRLRALTDKVVLPLSKQTVTSRLDADLLDWLRREKKYQTRINAVLRAYMEAQRS